MTTTRDSQLPLAAHQAQAFAAVRLLPRPPWDGLQASAARGIGSLLPDLIGGQLRGTESVSLSEGVTQDRATNCGAI